MTIKIGNIGKYMLFPKGQALNLFGEEKRKARVEVNTEYETRLDVVLGDGQSIFLAKVDGHAVIEFIVEGPCVVQPTSEGEVWLSTDEGPHIVYETDEPSFVELDFSKTELNHFERMQAIANLRRDQREEESKALLEELRERKAELEAMEAAANVQPVKQAGAKKSSDDPVGKPAAGTPDGAGKPKPEGEGARSADAGGSVPAGPGGPA